MLLQGQRGTNRDDHPHTDESVELPVLQKWYQCRRDPFCVLSVSAIRSSKSGLSLLRVMDSKSLENDDEVVIAL